MSLLRNSLARERANNIFVEDEELRSEQLKSIFSCALTVTMNYLGTPSYPFTTSARELFDYTHDLCDDLDEGNRKEIEIQLCNKAKEPRQVQVEVTVHGARIIQPSFSEAYMFCKLWVDGSKKEFTTAHDQKETGNWDEKFKLNLSTFEEDRIHFELWIVRTRNVIKSVNSNKLSAKKSSIWHKSFFLCSGYDEDLNSAFFVGKASENAMNLPSVAENMTIRLLNENVTINLHAEIMVTVGLTAKANFLHDEHIQLHIAMLHLCYEKQIEQERVFKPWKSWLDILPIPALTLIHQHGIQYGLTDTEQTLSAWLVSCALKINKENRMGYNLLRKLLEEIFIEAVNNPLSSDLCKTYHRSTTKFLQFVASEMTALHSNFAWTTDEGLDELFDFLRCVSIIESNINDNYMSYQAILEEECKQYYLSVIQLANADLEDSMSVSCNIDGLKTILNEFITNQIYLDDIFRRTWNVSYTIMTYQQLDNIMANIIRPIVKHLGEKLKGNGKKKFEDVLKMLQLYHHIRNLVEYFFDQLPQNTKYLNMESYPSWFPENMIACWFVMSRERTGDYILKAVERDTMEQLDSIIMHGTSAPDIVNIIDEMVVMMWMKLSWEYQFFTHSALSEAIQLCAVDYFEAIQRRCFQEEFFCKEETFYISKKLCVALSNVYAVYDHLHLTREKIQNELVTAQKEYSFALLDSSDAFQDELLRSLSHVFSIVVKKIKGKLLELVSNILKRTDERSRHKSISTLTDFVEQCLEVLYFSLLSEPFTIILRAFWITILESLHEKMNNFLTIFLGPSKNMFFTISEALDTLEKVFNCKGKGLSFYEMKNKKYTALKTALQRRRSLLAIR